MLKSERRPVRTALSQVFWFAVQAAVVIGCLYIEFDISRETGKQGNYALALFIGIGFALVVTVLWAIVYDALLRLWLCVAGGEAAEIGQSSGEGESLPAPLGGRGQAPEILSRARIGQEPRKLV